MTPVEAALAGLGFIIVLMAAAWAGRRGATLMRGLMLGVAAGLLASFVVGFALALSGYLFPAGQLQFWLAHLLHG